MPPSHTRPCTPGPAKRKGAGAVMAAVGQTVWLDDEALIDPVTAVSGSGPAYVFYFLEAMEAAAREMGLPGEEGKRLALATFMGATQLAMQSGESPATLRQRVSSTGGTRHAGITATQSAGGAEAVVSAAGNASSRASPMSWPFLIPPRRRIDPGRVRLPGLGAGALAPGRLRPHLPRAARCGPPEAKRPG